jgi:dethiobiotin synthetase
VTPEPQRLTICGTDTGAGKTISAAAIARTAIAAGRTVGVLKPLQTGDDDDGAEVDRLCGREVARTGRRLAAPLAPAVAARLEGVRLEPPAIVAWVRAEATADTVVVETAGGSAVEVTEGYDMAALASDLGFPVLITCRAGLGTLNHTLLTAEHLRRRGATVAGLVVCGYPAEPGLAESTNLRELPRLTGLPIVGVIPVLEQVSPAAFDAAPAWLAPVLGGTLDVERDLPSPVPARR